MQFLPDKGNESRSEVGINSYITNIKYHHPPPQQWSGAGRDTCFLLILSCGLWHSLFGYLLSMEWIWRGYGDNGKNMELIWS